MARQHALLREDNNVTNRPDVELRLPAESAYVAVSAVWREHWRARNRASATGPCFLADVCRRLRPLMSGTAGLGTSANESPTYFVELLDEPRLETWKARVIA